MIRTQIYITEQESASLTHLMKTTGKSQSELIRQAIDLFCETQVQDNRLALMRKAKGVWENRQDLPDFKKLRKEIDRKD